MVDNMMSIEKDDATHQITIGINVDDLLRSELGWSEEIDPEEGPIGRYPGGNGRIIDRVVNALAVRIQDDVKRAAVAAVTQVALEKVDGLIDETMNGDITVTASYGSAKGKAVPLREAMVNAMVERLNEKVDMDGRRRTDSWGSSRPYLDWHLDKVARDVMDKELSRRLSDAVKQIRDAAKDVVAKKIAAALGSAL